jgi:hypothetical protein
MDSEIKQGIINLPLIGCLYFALGKEQQYLPPRQSHIICQEHDEQRLQNLIYLDELASTAEHAALFSYIPMMICMSQYHLHILMLKMLLTRKPPY